MGCNCNGCNESDNNNESNERDENCVADVVRGIIRAQRRALEAEQDTCFTSCDRSIEDLISPFEENRDRFRNNTIPFILICKENCKPFVGVGVRRERDRRSDRNTFECVESPIFRAKSFVNDDENCVRLELLKAVRGRRDDHDHDHDHNHGGHGDHDKRGESEERGRHEHENHKRDREEFCDLLPRNTRDFRATGICITVDLNCFCGISCLEPITPLRARFPEDED